MSTFSEADRLRLLEAGRKLLEERRRAAPAPRSTPTPPPTAPVATPSAPVIAPVLPTMVPTALGSSSSGGGGGGDDEAKLRAKSAAQLKRIDQLVAEKTDLTARIDQLERNTLEICTENSSLRTRLEEMQRKCEHFEEENTRIRSELHAPPPVDALDELRKQLEEKTNAARDLQRRLTQSETTSTQRARTIDALERDIHAEKSAHALAVRALEEKLAAAIAIASQPPPPVAAPLPPPPASDEASKALAAALAEANEKINELTLERTQLQGAADRVKQLEGQLERAHNEKQVLIRTHQLELQHAEETKTREIQSRLTAATGSVQQTLVNLQSANASMQTTISQLEQQLRDRTLELDALKTENTQARNDTHSTNERLMAEVATLKKELAHARQTCEETLGLAEALQQTMDSLLQNGQAQEEVIAHLQARVQRLELDRDELRVVQAADSQRIRDAMAEATAAGEQPTTLEELQEQKIVQLLAQIATLEELLRERTATVSKLSDQQFELAHELEKSKKTSAKYWTEQQDASRQSEAVLAQYKTLLKELHEVRAALKADSRRAVLIPDIISRLDALVTSDAVAAGSSSALSLSVTSPPSSSSSSASLPSSNNAPANGGAASSSSSQKDKKHKHNHNHEHNHSHGHSHGNAPRKAVKQVSFREWIFGAEKASS